MIPYAAIDLRQGEVVQLVGGDPEAVRVRLPDPAAVALRWEREGFTHLHVVDLDAALGTGSNRSAIQEILTASSLNVQVGGGVRDEESIEALLEAGAARVVVGTRGVRDRPWLTAMTDRFPQRIILAADCRDERVVVNGWTADAGESVDRLLNEIADLPLAGVLVTDVTREGRMEGVDAELFQMIRSATNHPVLASGGVATMDDLRTLRAAGADGVVLGMALYTGALIATLVTQEFAG